jgi:hypothetical protein
VDLLSAFPHISQSAKEYSRLHQSFYVLVDPTIRMVLGVGAIGRVVVGNRLLRVSILFYSPDARAQPVASTLEF